MTTGTASASNASSRNKPTPFEQFRPLGSTKYDIILGSFTINILSLALPIVLLQVYDRILPNEGLGTLALLITGVGIALLLEGALRMGRSYLTSWAGARFEHQIGTEAVKHLMRSNLASVEQEGSGVHLERLNAMGTLRDFYSGQAILTAADLPFVAIYLLLIYYLAGWLVLVPIGLLVLFALSALFVGIKLRTALKKRSIDDERRYNFIIEVLTGIHTVKGLSMEPLMTRRYERLQENCAQNDHKVALWSNDANNLSNLFSQFTMVLVAALGATIVIDSDLTIGGLAACTLLAGRTMQPIQRALGIWTRFQSIIIAKEDVNTLFAQPVETEADLPPIAKVEGAVELKNVSFRFNEDTPRILDNVSLSLKPGECIALKGEAGCGKTTLLNIMMGTLTPQSGSVMVDQQDMRKYDPDSVRQQIAYLPQDGVVFNGTLLENLTMFRGEEYQEEALRAARLLLLDKVADRLPNGFETRVGDGATDSLPRGIKQRVAIARALVNRPRIVLFDAATSGLDSTGDAVVRAVMERLKGKCTLVIVSFRPSLLKLADRTYELKEGKLTEILKEIPSGDVPTQKTEV